MFETCIIYNDGSKVYRNIVGELETFQVFDYDNRGILMFNPRKYVEEIRIGSGVTSINNDCFNSIGLNIKRITIPSSIKVIKKSTFESCSDVEEIVINEGVERIEDFSFRFCLGLVNVVIPSSMKYISENSFEGCDKLNKISKKEISKVIKKQKILSLNG